MRDLSKRSVDEYRCECGVDIYYPHGWLDYASLNITDARFSGRCAQPEGAGAGAEKNFNFLQ